MRLILISQPDLIPGESRVFNQVFKSGLQILHLRKPHASLDQMSEIVEGISDEFHSRIMLHSQHSLSARFAVKVKKPISLLDGCSPERR